MAGLTAVAERNVCQGISHIVGHELVLVAVGDPLAVTGPCDGVGTWMGHNFVRDQGIGSRAAGIVEVPDGLGTFGGTVDEIILNRWLEAVADPGAEAVRVVGVKIELHRAGYGISIGLKLGRFDLALRF